MPPASLICCAARLAAPTMVLPAETNEPDCAAITPMGNSSSARAACKAMASPEAAMANPSPSCLMHVPPVTWSTCHTTLLPCNTAVNMTPALSGRPRGVSRLAGGLCESGPGEQLAQNSDQVTDRDRD